MQTPVDVIRARSRRRERAERATVQRLRRLAVGLALAFSLVLALGAVAAALFYVQITAGLPSVAALPGLLDGPDGRLLHPTSFTDRTGQVVLYEMANPLAGPRIPLTLDNSQENYIPKTLVDAVVAAIDPTFWQHAGYLPGDWTGQQPNTIALRLVSTLLTQDEAPGLRRSLRERLLAAQLTRQYGREQVLAWYLTSAHFGKLAYGVEPAARLYFDKHAAALTLAEAALLAAILDAPALNPIDTPEAAFERQIEVLQQMETQGLAEPAALQAARAARPNVRIEPPAAFAGTDAFLNLVQNQLTGLFTLEELQRGGYRVVTTLDAALQSQAECVLAAQLSRFVAPEQASTSIAPQCTGARLLPSLDNPGQALPPNTAGNVVVLDPASGQVLALAALAADGQPLNRLAAPPPGSLLTPYVYLSAFTRGFNPASLVWDIPASLPVGISVTPNLDGVSHGPMRMRTALANDYLAPAVFALGLVGPETVWKTAQQLGLPALNVPPGESALGLIFDGGSLSLLDAAHAFGAFGAQGVLVGYPYGLAGQAEFLPGVPTLSPGAMLRVEDVFGNILYDAGPPQARPVISAQLAYLLVNILSDEAARWPSLGHPNVLEIGRPAAVKIGRTSDQQQSWAVGQTPQRIVGVWIGASQPAGGVPGTVPALAAAGAWHALAKVSSQDLPPEAWRTPPGISTIEVCDPSGQLPTQDCPVTVREVFAPGSEPVQYDTLYRRFQINRETGYLATVFTPPSLVETRVYMVVPPEAAGWAQSAGVPTPPEVYDLVSMPANQPAGAQVSRPAMFAYVRGVVDILGTAAGADFASYRVQVGQGLNPQQWLLVGEEQPLPVEDDLLAAWDTAGLNGLFAIRLQVIAADRRTQTSILQVTVDNQPPEVGFTYPEQDQVFPAAETRRITVQLNAQDELALDRVEVFLNGRLQTTLTQAPFAFSLGVSVGEYSLSAIAYDRAGNQSETQVVFTVER